MVICPDLRGYGDSDKPAADGPGTYSKRTMATDIVTLAAALGRASAGIDIEHDQADRAAGRQLAMPVTVVQQDWGAALGYDAAALWRPWAADLVHQTVDCGHFMAEEAPGLITTALRQLIARERPPAAASPVGRQLAQAGAQCPVRAGAERLRGQARLRSPMRSEPSPAPAAPLSAALT
jgi:pimeloyl-ACP methyl ester carboxylesterase